MSTSSIEASVVGDLFFGGGFSGQLILKNTGEFPLSDDWSYTFQTRQKNINFFNLVNSTVTDLGDGIYEVTVTPAALYRSIRVGGSVSINFEVINGLDPNGSRLPNSGRLTDEIFFVDPAPYEDELEVDGGSVTQEILGGDVQAEIDLQQSAESSAVDGFSGLTANMETTEEQIQQAESILEADSGLDLTFNNETSSFEMVKFDITDGSSNTEQDFRSYLEDNGGDGYFKLINGNLVPIDIDSVTTEAELRYVYYCSLDNNTAVSVDPNEPSIDFGSPITSPAPTAPSAPTINLNPVRPPKVITIFEELCTCVDDLPSPDPEPTPFEGYDPINNWQPQRRVEINPGGPAADPLGDELVINDARGRLFGINNRASDSTYDSLTGVAFVMGEEGAFDDGSIAGDEYVGTLEFDLQEGYRTTANFNNAQLNPILGAVSPEGTLDGALVDTETGAVMALFEDVNVL